MPTSPPIDPSSFKRVLTVSALTGQIKQLLEQSFSLIWIEGEISNLRIAPSGHRYFVLKDPSAQISAVMFKGQAKHLGFDLVDGASIIGLGRVSVYEPRGNYQFILELIEPKGLGSLYIRFENLKKKLAEEGLFDSEHKQPIPVLPRQICLITSISGAVVHDMLRILTQRYANLPVEIIPVNVQGKEAVDDIVNALSLLNSRMTSDIAILARGGGSLEDFQAFNSEAVARAIFRSTVPIVSAVGHETDVTIADFVADHRAATPTAAAAMVVPEKDALILRIQEVREQLVSLVKHRLVRSKEDALGLSRRLVHPKRRLEDFRIRLDDIVSRMEKALVRRVSTDRDRWGALALRLTRNPLSPALSFGRAALAATSKQLRRGIQNRLSCQQSSYRELMARLEAISPMAVLERGYSITRTLPEKMVVIDAGDVFESQELEVILARGRLTCRVEGLPDGKKDL
jgi:exodeoxyribonuclease VII large subunit